MGLLAALMAGLILDFQPSARAETTSTNVSKFVLGQPAVARNADGRLELFKVDADGEMRHRWQREANGDWSSWISLGGSVYPGLGTGLNAAGEIEVFAVGRATDSVQVICQKTAAHGWSGWTNLGGPSVPPVAVGRDADGRLEIFVLDKLGAALHLSQTNALGGWSDWTNMGGRFEPGLVVEANADGRLELFGVDKATALLLHCWQLKANEPAWSEWTSLERSVSPGFSVARNAEGNLEVFAVGLTNDNVWRRKQVRTPRGVTWRKWEDFGGNVQPGIATALNADGRLEVFGVKHLRTQSDILHTWEIVPGGPAWSGWFGMEGSSLPAPTIGRNQDGNLEIFAMDKFSQGVVNHRRQISGNKDWLYWRNMDRSPSAYSSRIWQTDEGLPNNRVQAIAQTPDGYLWVGTYAGLARFDGVAFTPITRGGTGAFKNESITALCVDPEGTLWIGTDGRGLACLRKGQLSRFATNNDSVGQSIRALSLSRDGSIWVASDRGLTHVRDGKFTIYNTSTGLLSDNVHAVCEDSDGAVWVATAKGLNRLAQGRLETFTTTNGLPNGAIHSLSWDRGRRLWIGSDAGLTWYSLGKYYTYTGLQGLSDNYVSSIFEDGQRNLWVGTYSGLNRFVDGHFQPELNDHGMPYDHVNTMFEDDSGNVWVGSREGLIRLTVKPFSVLTKRQGLSHNHVTSVLEDHLGRLWVGTWGGGLNRVTEDGVRVYSTTNHFPADIVLALCESRDGSIWAGADQSGGLIRFNNQGLRQFTVNDGLLEGAVSALCEDHDGRLFVGTTRGLCLYDHGAFIRKTDWPSKPVHAICAVSTNSILVGSDDGLAEWDGDRFLVKRIDARGSAGAVTALCADGASNLWIGTATSGLFWQHGGRSTRFTTRNGLFTDEIWGILPNRGWLWLTSTKGIFRVQLRELEACENGEKQVIPCITYGKDDGLESIVCSSIAAPPAWKTGDDRLCFATTKGLAITDGRNTQVDAFPPAVYVEQIDVDRKPTSFQGDNTLNIAPSRGELEFHYTALDLRAPEKCAFKYKLDGVDSDWVDAGSHRIAHYNNLAPGAYTFHVLAGNKDGVWNEKGTSLQLFLEPHVWQTWWFRTLSGIALIIAVAGIIRYLEVQKIRQKMAALKVQHSLERDRARISQDIHDDLGATLTQITLLSELARRDAHEPQKVGLYTSQISHTASELVQAMDEIVWAINPRNDSVPMLAGYIFQHAESFFAGTSMLCRFDSPDEIPEGRLTAEARHHFFLVAKEALNNAARHSGGTEVWLRLRVADGELHFRIEDNGKGYAPGTNDKFGNGLANMKRRMEEIGGAFELISPPEGGTCIYLKLPLSAN
jgi:ligand-binding sensor domain-containing protein/signal transduction histidine kinase